LPVPPHYLLLFSPSLLPLPSLLAVFPALWLSNLIMIDIITSAVTTSKESFQGLTRRNRNSEIHLDFRYGEISQPANWEVNSLLQISTYISCW
jgi:hypothetical protein